jgi:periplasmic protein TonB
MQLLQNDDSRFGVMLTASLLLHMVLILGVKFAAPELKKLKDQMPALEVELVNAKSESRPEKADVLAQANLNRGGNTEAERRMKSPLPAPKNKPQEFVAKPAAEAQQAATHAAQLQAEAQQKEQRVAELEKQAREMLTQAKSKQMVESHPNQPVTSPQPEQGRQDSALKTADTTDLVTKSFDMARLEAQISKDWDGYLKRPKRKYIGARAQEYRFAAYVESWRQKVEKIGNLNYPEEAKANKLYGQLLMTVSIRADGSLENVEINKSSGHKVLDDAARRIVEMAAPYAVFPEDIRKDTDVLGITRTWTFTREDTISGGN